jgi:hypothetical protein
LVLESSGHNRQQTDPSTGGKLVVQYFNPYREYRRTTSSGKEWKTRELINDLNANSGSNLKLLQGESEKQI